MKLTARLIIRVPESDSDKRYQRELIQTSIDIEKFLKGVGGNWFTRGIMKDIRSCLDFDPIIPLPKVLDSSRSILRSHDVLFKSQGVYHLTNLTISDTFFPPIVSSKFFVDIKATGKFHSRKNAVHFTSWTAFGEVKAKIHEGSKN
jgi:hypothetical protein